MKKVVLFLFVSISFLGAFGQTGSIKGRVYNAKTNEPVEFANILIKGTDIGSTSDLDGNFIFTGIASGFLRLVVSVVGFETTESPEIQVQGNQTAFVDIAVSEASFAIKEVVVRSTVNNLKRIESPVSLLSVGVQEIEKSAGANRDVSKVVQSLPGVGATDPNRNDLIVRGGGPSENVFYLDGIEIPVINHFATQGSSGGAVGIINPDFVREINFYTGAFPANRTNALSSVMEIKQKDGSKDRVHTKLSVGASDAALTIDGPVGKKSTFIVSARQSYLQFLFSVLGLPFLPTYNDFQVKYKIQLDRKNEITFLGIGAIDDMTLNLDIKNPTESQRYILDYLPVYKQWNYTVGVVYKHYADTHYDSWVLSRNMLRNANFKYRDNDETLPKTSDYKSDEAENKLRFERNYPDLPVKLMFGGGLVYSHYTNRTYRQLYINNAISELNYTTDLNLFGYQVFAQASDEYLDDLLKLSLGVSAVGTDYNKNMMNPWNQFSPRLSASFALTPQFDINANLGRYAMRPAYTTLGYRDETGILVNQNENLKYIISNQAIFGFEYRPQKKMKVTVEAFYKQYEQYPLSVADGISIASKGTDYGQVGDEEIVSTGKGKAYGVEVLYKAMEWKNLNVTSTYTYFRSLFTNVNGAYLPSSWDTKHLFNFMANYKFPKSWNVAMRWRFVGGAPYTPIDVSLSTLKSAWNVTNQPYLDYSKFNSLRLKSSHQLDVRIDKEFYFKKWVLNLYTDVQNVYNFKTESAPIYTNRDVDGNTVTDSNDASRYVLRSFNSLGGTILPTIGLIIKM
ncbi:MAG: TonB-dependent receptor [Paludibacter sp.]|nr:TonB-dependent receptor [Paludibacter sp.]